MTPGGGSVVALHPNRTRHRPLDRVDTVRATAQGIEGDIHAGRSRGRRQVLLMDAGDLRTLGLCPGDLREQITVDLPGLMALPVGTQLSVGDAELQITGPCEPCTHIGEHVGVGDPEALRERLRGRRGMPARVVDAGLISVGDPVTPATAPTRA